MPVWETADWAGWRLAFLDSMATMQLPAMGYGLRYEYGMFKQTIRGRLAAGAARQLAAPPGSLGGRAAAREGGSAARTARSRCAAGRLHAIAGRPSSLIGIPYDRPVVGYGGKTINTLRLWAAAAPDYFDFQEFSHGDFVGARGGDAGGRNRSRGCSIRTIRPTAGRDCASCRSISWSRVRWRIWCAASGAAMRTGSMLPEKAAIQLNDTHPSMAVAELMRILLDDAHLGWDQAWDLTQRTLGVHQPHAAARSAGEMAGRRGSRLCCRAIWRSSTRSTAVCSMTVRTPISGRRRTRAARQPGRRGRRRKSAHGEPGDRRLAQHQRRGGDSFASCCARRRSRTWPRCFPERFNNKTNGVTPRRWLLLCEPGARRRDHRRPSAKVGSPISSQLSKLKPLADDQGFPRSVPARRSSEAKVRFADWLKSTSGADRGPGHHLRLPDQAHPRIQAATAECAAHRGALQPAAGESRTWRWRRGRSSSPARRRRPTSWPS